LGGSRAGDSEEPAKAVAAAVGIRGSQVFWGVKPEGKKEVVERLQREGCHVVMVGDGFNDTAALARADVGMAMGSALTPASEVPPPPSRGC
jgi:P-type E1-E2 ATPase